MRRSVWPASALLAALTATILFGAAVGVRPPAPPAEADSEREAANRALAHRFYGAVNEAIATGRLDALAAITGPGVLPDPADPASAPAGLARRLLALHAGSPALRLSVAALAVDGETAVVQVAVAGDVATAFLGLDLRDRPPPWSPVDVLRLVDGRVVAFNGAVSPAGWLEPPLATPLHLLTTTRPRLTISRLTLAPGAGHSADAVAGVRLLLAERGEVEVRVTSIAVGTVEEATLRPGDELVLRSEATPPRSTAYQAHNPGEAPAVLLDVTLTTTASAAPANRPAATGGSGVASEVLMRQDLGEEPAGPAMLTLGRAILAPSDRLAWTGGAGPTLLGVDDLAQGGRATGPIAAVREAVGGRAVAGEVGLGAGSALLVPAGTAVAVRALAARPVTLLVATLLPFDPAAPTELAAPDATAANVCPGPDGVTRADPARCTP